MTPDELTPRGAPGDGVPVTQEFVSLRALALPIYGPSLLFGCGEGAILAVLVMSARERGANVATAAAVVMLVALGSLVFNVPASVLTDRFGERRALIGGGVAATLSALGCALAPELVGFALSVAAFGASSAVFLLARQTYMAQAVPLHLRARAMSALGGSMRIGMFVGPFLGALAVHLVGLRGAYLVCAVAVAVAGWLGSLLPDLSTRSADPETEAAVTVRQVWQGHRRVLMTVGIGVLLVGAVRASRQAVIPLWADHLGLSPQVSSTISGLSGGIDMLVFYPAGKVMDLYGRRWVTVPSMLIMALGLALLPLSTQVLGLTAVGCVLGFGNGIGAGMIMTLGADFAPAQGRAQFLGLWRLLSDLGQTSGPGLLSVLTAVLSLGPAIVGCAVLGLVAAAVMWRSVPPRLARAPA